MFIRLSVFTALLAVFAVGFSEIVEHGGRGDGAFAQVPTAGCYDQGAVCAPVQAN